MNLVCQKLLLFGKRFIVYWTTKINDIWINSICRPQNISHSNTGHYLLKNRKTPWEKKKTKALVESKWYWRETNASMPRRIQNFFLWETCHEIYLYTLSYGRQLCYYLTYTESYLPFPKYWKTWLLSKLNLSQTTNFRLFQTEWFCWQQFMTRGPWWPWNRSPEFIDQTCTI